MKTDSIKSPSSPAAAGPTPPAGARSARQQLESLASGFTAAIACLDYGAVGKAGGILLASRKQGRTVWLCGNGGSASLANHAACDLSKAGLRAVSLAALPEVLTMHGNDEGFENVYSAQVERLARPRDVLLAVTSSGKSLDIINAITRAASQGVHAVALTGFTGGETREQADVAVHVDSHDYGVVETVHQAVLHALAAHVRSAF